MGQQHSGFVVEIAEPKLGRFQAVPQKDPDESPAPEWRITVNPAAELFGSARLKQLIDRLYHHQKLLTPSDAKQILYSLQGIDPASDLLLPLLTVLSNATAYPANQMLMRELKITEKVVNMLIEGRSYWPAPCKLMLLQCVANMAVSKENDQIVKKSTEQVINRLAYSQDETEVTVALQALTNLTLRIAPHEVEFKLWIRGEVNINAIRLLVNLSCCPDLVPQMLGAKGITGLMRILDSNRDEILLRAITWLLCTSSAVEALNITYDRVAEYNQDPFRNPAQTIYFSIYGPKNREELESRCKELLTYPYKDVAEKSRRLLEILAKISPFPITERIQNGSTLNRL